MVARVDYHRLGVDQQTRTTTLMKDPLLGRIIDGYRIEQLLGQGGMAQVYQALDLKLERRVAIKIISPQMRDPDAYQERFNREARSVAALKHPNIVGVYRYNDEDALFFMAMEFIDGADLGWVLRDYRSRGELMDYDTLGTIMQQMTSALDYSHQQGVIHRDIKPSNIMIDRDGVAYLTDFGLALKESDGTRGEIFGTPHYISPEQATNSAKVVPVSDFYSLAVVLYEMLTGRLPFAEGSALEIAQAHLDATLPDPLTYQPTLHPQFLPVLNKALAKQPADRYASGADFHEAVMGAIEAAKAASDKHLPTQTAKPAARIAKHRSKLQAVNVIDLPTVYEQAKAPISDTAAASKSGERRRLSPIGAVIATALLFAAAALFLFATRSPSPAAAPPPTEAEPNIVVDDGGVTARIVGPITDYDRSNVVTIYDVPVIFDEREDFLNEIEIGGRLEFEGQYRISEDGAVIVQSIERISVSPAPDA